MPELGSNGPQPAWTLFMPDVREAHGLHESHDDLVDCVAAQDLSRLVECCGHESFHEWAAKVFRWYCKFGVGFEGYVCKKRHPWLAILKVILELQGCDFVTGAEGCCVDRMWYRAQGRRVELLPM